MVAAPDLVPLSVTGLVLVAAGIHLWTRPSRAPAAASLGALLILRAALNLTATLWFFDPDSGFALRAWPALDALVAGTAFIYAYRAGKRGLRTGSDGIISAIRLFTWLTAGLVVFAPNLYWGDATTDGPLFAINGLKFVGYAAIAVVLIGPAMMLPGSRAARGQTYVEPTDAGRHGLFLLGAAWALDVIYWNAVDGLVIQAMGARLPDIRNGIDHFGRLLAVPIGAWIVIRLIGQGRISLVPDRRGFAKASLVVLMTAIAIPVLFFDLHAFGVTGESATNLGLVLWLDAVFTIPAGLVVFHPWLRPRARVKPTLDATHGGADEESGTESQVLAGLRFPGS